MVMFFRIIKENKQIMSRWMDLSGYASIDYGLVSRHIANAVKSAA